MPLNSIEIISDLKQQARWINAEIVTHSHDKTSGYEEKRHRLQLDQDDPQSVLGFMGRYWHTFQTFRREVGPDGDPRALPLAIQQMAKVPNGLVDKVGLVLWEQKGQKPIYAEEACELVLDSAIGSLGLVESVDYPGQILNASLADTIIGDGIVELHGYAVSESGLNSPEALTSAINTAVHGMFTWQAYTAQVRDMQLDPTPPMPGMPSGEIATWREA